MGGDLVGSGLVASLARPGGNITGLTSLSLELTLKRLELLKEAFPDVSRVAVLWIPDGPVPALARAKQAVPATSSLAYWPGPGPGTPQLTLGSGNPPVIEPVPPRSIVQLRVLALQ